jgi:hypothetical protein
VGFLRAGKQGYSHLVLNDLGFHDVNVPREKQNGSFRVAVLGNSLTMAAQVGTSETYMCPIWAKR